MFLNDPAWYAVRYYPCPLCHAPPGFACHSTRELPDGHHLERTHAATAAAEALTAKPQRRPYDLTDDEIAWVPDDHQEPDEPLVLLEPDTKLGQLQRRAFQLAGGDHGAD